MIARYSLPEMEEIWSDETRFGIWLDIELAAAQALASRGVIPRSAVAELRRKAGFDVQRILEIEAEVQHDVIAFLTAVAEKAGEPARYLHYGLTSSDVLDTALSVQIQRAGRLLCGKLEALLELVAARAWAWIDVPILGRTHGVFAEPMSLGHKAALWYGQLERDRERLEAALQRTAVGKLSGAVGNFAHVEPYVEAHVCKALGLKPAPASSQVVQRDRHAELLSAFAICGGTIERIALEVRLLQRSEVREMEEGFSARQKGSSAMPHKRNPIVCERLCGMARLLRSYAAAGLENIALWHERDISHSSVERVIFPDATHTLYYMLVQTVKLIDRLEVHTDRMAATIQAGGGVVFSQRVLLALAQAGLSREEAYRLVQGHAHAAWNRGGSFRERLEKDPAVTRHLKRRALADCFDLRPYMRHARTILRRTVPKG